MNQIFREEKGFTLVELAIVLVIIGLIVGTGFTVWRTTLESTRLSTTKSNLENIKSAVINFAIANGRLPCSDTIVPPLNQGDSNPLIAGACACANPPCYVPFKTLQIQLPGGRDSFGNVFQYDVSGGLTNTTRDTFCGVLSEYMSQSTVPPIPAPLIPYVTNAAGQGYTVAAVIISQTPVNNFFNVQPPPPLPRLTGKNVVGADREYEMANRANDTAYGDLVAELTYGELYNKMCNSQNTRLAVYAPPAPPNNSVRIPSGGSCYSITTGVAASLTIGQTMDYYAGCNNCTTNAPTCDSGGPTTPNVSFLTLTNTDWTGPPATRRNGQVNANNTDH